MDTVTHSLRRLRLFFVVYVVAKVAVEVGMSRGLRFPGSAWESDWLLPNWGVGWLSVSLALAGLLLILGLVVFSRLLAFGKGARILLLVAGWLMVIDAVVSLLLTGPDDRIGPWLDRLIPGVDWPRLIMIDRVTDLIGLLFWGYLIYLLQFHPQVTQAFCKSPASPTTPPSGDGPSN